MLSFSPSSAVGWDNRGMTITPEEQNPAEEELRSETITERHHRETVEWFQERARKNPELAERLIDLWAFAHINGHEAAHTLPRPTYVNPFWRQQLWGL